MGGFYIMSPAHTETGLSNCFFAIVVILFLGVALGAHTIKKVFNFSKNSIVLMYAAAASAVAVLLILDIAYV